MLALSLHDVVNRFGAHAAALPLWFASMAAATLLTRRLFNDASVEAHPGRGNVLLHGSWVPLALMLAIFCVKYAVSVSLSLAPPLLADAAFIAAVCTLYGVFNGVFLGQLAAIVSIYRGGVGRKYKLM